jgi:hypothetical protein
MEHSARDSCCLHSDEDFVFARRGLVDVVEQ